MSTWLEIGSDGGSGGNLAGYWPYVMRCPPVSRTLLTVEQTILGVSPGAINPIFCTDSQSGSQPGPVAGPNGAVTGWVGFIKVDGTTYTWMGAPNVNGVVPPLVTQDSFDYTSQRSTFIMNVAGKVTMNVTFISPLTPTDIKRQSVIGTYLSVEVVSRDGATHNVQLYSDTSAGMSLQKIIQSFH